MAPGAISPASYLVQSEFMNVWCLVSGSFWIACSSVCLTSCSQMNLPVTYPSLNLLKDDDEEFSPCGTKVQKHVGYLSNISRFFQNQIEGFPVFLLIFVSCFLHCLDSLSMIYSCWIRGMNLKKDLEIPCEQWKETTHGCFGLSFRGKNRKAHLDYKDDEGTYPFMETPFLTIPKIMYLQSPLTIMIFHFEGKSSERSGFEKFVCFNQT